MSDAQAIVAKIERIGRGKAFTASDFSDVTNVRNAGNVLGRLYARGDISRAMRGVYYVPERSELLGCDVPVSVDEAVRAVARANKWIVVPAGDFALNVLGLDTQVPAKYVYVSSGPYKSYDYGPYHIELLHRANRDLLSCSEMTCTIVQALKAVGRELANEDTARMLASNLTSEQVDAFRRESSGMTMWVVEFSKLLKEAKDGQNRQG